MPSVTQVVVAIPEKLTNITDANLAALWHVAQLQPAPLGDYFAGELVGRLTSEILRRWLRNTAPEMGNHSPDTHHWNQLTRFAKYVPNKDDFHAGEWVAKEQVAVNDLIPAEEKGSD